MDRRVGESEGDNDEENAADVVIRSGRYIPFEAGQSRWETAWLSDRTGVCASSQGMYAHEATMSSLRRDP
jgi:hypothetical protein